MARYFTCKCTDAKHGALTGCSGEAADFTGGLCVFCIVGCAQKVATREREACEVCKDSDAFPISSYSMGDIVLRVCQQCVKDLKKAEV